MKTLLCSLALCAIGTGALAQNTSNSGSASNAASQLTLNSEATSIPDNTPGLGGLVGSSGNCYPGASVQGVWPGGGFGIGGGRVDPECNVRMEMSALATVSGNKAAILHACREDESMRGTLMAMGLCVVQKAPTRPVAKSNVKGDPVVGRISSQGKLYTSCRMEGGQLRVGVPKGASAQVRTQAVSQCKRDI